MQTHVMIEIDYILSFWLVKVPKFASTVVLLVLLDTIVSIMSSTFNIAIRATGEIKNYELSVNFIHIMGFPTIFILLYVGFSYHVLFIVWIAFSILALLLESYWLNRLLPFISLKEIYLSTLLTMFVTAILSVFIPLIIYYLMDESFLRAFLVVITSFFSVIILSYSIGLNNSEKLLVLKYLNKFGIRLRN